MMTILSTTVIARLSGLGNRVFLSAAISGLLRCARNGGEKI